MARSRAALPAAVSIALGNKALQKALSTLFSDLRMIAAIKQAGEALAALLRKDAAALARTRSEVERLGRELAPHFTALGPNTRLDDFKSKSLQASLKERYRQLDRLVLTLRLVGRQDDWLLTLADAVGDNTIRSVFAEALSGGQYGVRPVAPKKLLRWLDSRNSSARGTAQNALYRTDEHAAHARWREVLTTSHDVEAIGDVLGLLEAHEKDLLPWASALFPHLRTTDANLLAALGRLISLKPALYRAYVTQALSAPKAELPRMLEVIADQLYWASLFSKSLLTDLKAPLLQLRQQAAQHALTKHVQRLDLALEKLG